MMRGTFRVARELVHHPELSGEPFDKRSAWLWLLSEAAWTRRDKALARCTVTLERSELIGASRYLAEAWGWTEARVRRWLDRLEARGMIGRRVHRIASSDAGVTVLRIANFDAWQGSKSRRGTDAVTDAEVDAEADAVSDATEPYDSGTNESDALCSDAVTDAPSDAVDFSKPTPTNRTIKERIDMLAPKAELERLNSEAKWPSDAFDRWYEAYPRKTGKLAARKAFDQARKRAEISFDDLLAATKAYAQAVAQWPKDRRQYIPHPASWLNKGHYLDEAGDAEKLTTSASIRDPRTFSDGEWTIRVQEHSRYGRWQEHWGPPPGRPGCLAPTKLMEAARGW